jgi:hypothetical protein
MQSLTHHRMAIFGRRGPPEIQNPEIVIVDEDATPWNGTEVVQRGPQRW